MSPTGEINAILNASRFRDSSSTAILSSGSVPRSEEKTNGEGFDQ
jgi:hypothetical protein